MRVLVTGSSGQLGVELESRFGASGAHEVLGLAHRELDIGVRDQVFQVVTSFGPQLIVSAGAYTNVDGCETDPQRAFRVNSLANRFLVEAADLVGAQVCYVSSDYVFNGEDPNGYREWSTPDPQSVYGSSKLGGELEMRPSDLIVRTSWVCSPRGQNFVLTMLRLAQGDGEVKVVDDQVGCPTFTVDLAEGIYRLTTARTQGRFHVTNCQPVSWFGFAKAIFDAAGADSGRVTPITTEELNPPRPAKRPAWSILLNSAPELTGESIDWRDRLPGVVAEVVGQSQ